MINYLKHTEIDKAKWDLCMEQAINPLVYGCSWFLDTACPGWDALVMDDYRAVMPLPHATKYFIHYAYQPFFTQQLGIFAKYELSQEMMLAFVQAIPKKFWYIDLNLNEQNQVLDLKVKLRKRKNFLLDLDKNYDKLQKNYDSHTKRNLKKAKKFDLEIKTIPYADVVAFYKLNKGLSTKGVKEKNYESLVKIFEKAHQRGLLLSKGIFTKNNDMIASVVFLTYKNRLIFMIGTGNDLGREYGAMYFLFDNIIYQFAGHNMFLDFEGSEIESIARFFKGFGSDKVNYYRLKLNRLPFFLRWLKN